MKTGRLDPRIGPADVRRYESILGAGDWANPMLVIRPDGINVTAKASTLARQNVVVADLQRILIELPVTAWPYGRVVAVTEIGIMAPDGRDGRLIAEHLRATLEILTRLKVVGERWPS